MAGETPFAEDGAAANLRLVQEMRGKAEILLVELIALEELFQALLDACAAAAS